MKDNFTLLTKLVFDLGDAAERMIAGELEYDEGRLKVIKILMQDFIRQLEDYEE